MEEKKEVRYLVKITGKGTNFEIPIDAVGDFENLENILKILKEKMQNVK